MKIADFFQTKTVFSFEIFPPKPEADESVIYKTLDSLSGLKPDFISVTYGAGGGKNGSKTIQIARDIKKRYGVENVAHLPSVSLSEENVHAILDDFKENGIENVLALRGDLQAGAVANGRFKYASDLISFMKENYDFDIIAACYPEGHSESPNVIFDIHNLKRKVDAGASHLISQLFFDNEYFYTFLERAKLAGINVPIEAGIMPVTNKAQIERMVQLCGVNMPRKFLKMINRYEHSPEAIRDAGIAYAIDQIVDLITQGVDGIHLYTMNNATVARRIYEAVHSLIEA